MNVELKYGHDRQVKDNIEFATSHDFSQERFCFSKLMNTHSHCTSFPCDILYSCFLNKFWKRVVRIAVRTDPFILGRKHRTGLRLLTLLETVIFNNNRSFRSHVHKYISKIKLATPRVLFHFCVYRSLLPWLRALDIELHTDAL